MRVKIRIGDAQGRGFTLVETVVALAIIGIVVGMLVPATLRILHTQRAQTTASELETVHQGIVGNPKQNTLGYLGDVGDYPVSLLDLIRQPVDDSNVPLPGWNGPYVSNVRLDGGILLDVFGGTIGYFNVVNPGNSSDSLALVSKGSDRTSTNTAAKPNLRGDE